MERAYSRKVLALIFSISLFNYIDRQVLYAVFPLIKKDLLLSDAQLGFLASSFMIIYMCFAPVVGYFGDRVRRPLIIGMSAVFWSFSTIISGLSRVYSQLAISRAAVGIGEAGYGTVSPAYLAEWFPLSQRGRIMAVYSLAIPVGSAIGYLLGGWLGGAFGWRNAFFIVAIPGIFLGLLALGLKETSEKLKRTEKPSLSAYPKLLKNRTFMFVALAQAVGTFSVGALAAWLPTYFGRAFGLSVAEAATYFGAVTVLAGISGNFAGGWIADWLRQRVTRAYFIIGYLSFLLALPFGAAAVMSDNLWRCLALVFMAEFFIFLHSGPYNAVLVEIVPARMRSMAFALDIFIVHAFGDAISPFLVGVVSDRAGLHLAVFYTVLYLGIGGVFSVLAGRSYQKDIELKEASSTV